MFCYDQKINWENGDDMFCYDQKIKFSTRGLGAMH